MPIVLLKMSLILNVMLGDYKVLFRAYCKVCVRVRLLEQQEESYSSAQGQHHEARGWSVLGILSRGC